MGGTYLTLATALAPTLHIIQASKASDMNEQGTMTEAYDSSFSLPRRYKTMPISLSLHPPSFFLALQATWTNNTATAHPPLLHQELAIQDEHYQSKQRRHKSGFVDLALKITSCPTVGKVTEIAMVAAIATTEMDVKADAHDWLREELERVWETGGMAVQVIPALKGKDGKTHALGSLLVGGKEAEAKKCMEVEVDEMAALVPQVASPPMEDSQTEAIRPTALKATEQEGGKIFVGWCQGADSLSTMVDMEADTEAAVLDLAMGAKEWRLREEQSVRPGLWVDKVMTDEHAIN
ncbi:hypothetical protein MMC13_005145 [Lambiella insularis]|nr:hypothetical protein [Lambiella insularis]